MKYYDTAEEALATDFPAHKWIKIFAEFTEPEDYHLFHSADTSDSVLLVSIDVPTGRLFRCFNPKKDLQMQIAFSPVKITFDYALAEER